MSKKNLFNKKKSTSYKNGATNVTSNSKSTSISEQQKKSFFQRWFRWDIITGIATILMLVIAIMAIIPSSPVDKIRDRIKSNIEIVETTFKPNILKEQNDSSKYISMLINLQQSTLDYCALWKTLDEAELYSKYSELSPSEIVNILSKEFNRINQLNKAASEIIMAIRDIQEFELLKDSTNVTSISHAKQNDILGYVELKKNITTSSQEKCLNYLTKSKEDKESDKDYKDNLKKGLEELDKVREIEDYYKMDDAIIDYAIECNKLFNISKRYYINK